MADAAENVVNEQPEQEQVASEAAPAVDADAAAAEVPATEAPAAEAPAADEQGGAAPEYGAPAVPDATGEQPEATEQQAAPAEGAEQAAGDAAPASDFVAAAQAQAAALAAKFAEDSNKRRLDDGDEPEAKRHQSNGASYGQVVINPGGDASFTLMAPPDKVGRIIGRAGVTIKDLEGRTSTRIQIDHKADGDKPVHVTGPSAGAVEACRSLIIDLLESENPYGQGAPGGDTTKSVSCPPGIVGRVIGRGGETIRSLQAASQAHIVVDQNFPADQDRQITISGRPDAVDRAVKMIQELVAGEPGSAQQIIQKYGAGLTRVLECAKAVVGRVIGKGGETIKDLQRRFSVSIQIDQSASPCKITIAGQGHTVDHCRQAILDILEDRPPHGMGGPGGGGGPGGFPGPRPGYGAPGPYGGGGGGYGGAPPFNPGYGGGGFGGAPAYGGYGGYGGPQPGYGGYGGQQPYPAAQPAYAQHAPAAGGYGSYGQAGAADPYAAYAQQQQAAPAQPAATSTWQELRDDQGRTYYYNSTTGVSQWERPAEMH